VPSSGHPSDSTTGPDGTLCFTGCGSYTIGQITTSAGLTEFALPANAGPKGITVGPDGTVSAVYWRRTFPSPPSSAPTPVRPIYYLRSADHGKTWSRLELRD